jgi:hypothetical protein
MAAWLTERAGEVRASIEAIKRLRGELSYLQLGWRPPDGGWSIAQVFEHLLISDVSYLPTIRHLIVEGRRGDTPWKPSFAGGLVINSVSPTQTRKTRAPRIFRPAAEARANVVDEYIRVREEFLRLLESAEGVDLRRNRMSSPVAKIMRMNLGDAFMILTVHTQRHLHQIERIRSHPEFPKS